MELSQQLINDAIEAYNEVTQAHKRAPVVDYIHKKLIAGDEVVLASGKTRWSSALVFSGTVDEVVVEFRINPALPESFQKILVTQQGRFLELLH